MRVIPQDKANHCIGGAWLWIIGATIARKVGMPAAAGGYALCAAAALCREAYNRAQDGVWSWADIAWTLAGGGTAHAASGAA